MSDCHERGRTRVSWHPRPDGLEESVQFTPGYNCLVEGWDGHGVHGMQITWLLRGPAGAVFLAMCTDWIPGTLRPGHGLSPEGVYHWDSRRYPGEMAYPDGAGLGYHARQPQYEDQLQSESECCVIGGPCWHDMGYLASDEPVRAFVRQGEQAVWDALEARYAGLVTEEQNAREAARNG